MSAKNLLIIAGLSIPLFDRVKAISGNRLAPGGSVIVQPNRGNRAYSERHASDLVQMAYSYIKDLREEESVAILLLYTDYADHTTERFLDNFFPFSLPYPVPPLSQNDGDNSNKINERINKVVDKIVRGSIELRQKARQVSEFTNVANLTPLLLPLRNFQSDALQELLKSLYKQLGTSKDAKELIKEEVGKFLSKNPRAYPPDCNRYCFCDGRHYFQSPGKHRHGFYRHSASNGHNFLCLLNARSRLGGSYDYKFHYDCLPYKGSLKDSYKNCHDDPTPPKTTHVNIAPNDFVI